MNFRSMKAFLSVVILILCCCTETEALYLNSSRGMMVMSDMKVRITISNQVAVTKIEQTYTNPHSSFVETQYSFPIGVKASVQEFGLTTNGERYAGAIEEKAEAEAIYRNAAKAGAAPAIARQATPNMFETKLGRIGPESVAVVDLTYSEVLDYNNGKIIYSFPLDMSQVQNGKFNLVSVVVEIKDQKNIISMESPTHQISKERLNDGTWKIWYENTGSTPDKDFQIIYEVEAQSMGINFLSTKYAEDEDGYFMLILAPQEIVDAGDISSREIVFVVDTSGSMSGYKMDQTKEAFNYFIEQLNSEDSFNIIEFSHATKLWKNEPVNATPDNRNAAKFYINSLRPSGGTNINGAILEAMKQLTVGTRSKAIIFLTDGEPTSGEVNPNRIASNVRESNTANVRTFVFGVGQDVNTALLNRIALENSGESLLVKYNEHLSEKLKVFYEKISKPLLVDLELDWGSIKVSECYPRTLPNVYKGSQLVITGRYQGAGDTVITLKGLLNGQIQEFPVKATFADTNTDNRFIARLWAKSKADHLISEIEAYGSDSSKKAEVIALSKRFQFTTPYTSFISVEPSYVQHNAHLDAYRNRKAPANVRNSSPVMSTAVLPQKTGNLTLPPRPSPSDQNTKPIVVIRTEPARKINLWGAQTFIPLSLATPNFRKARQQCRQKACFANQRVLLGAIEMYNMDNTEQITDHLDEKVIEHLEVNRYLRGKIQLPEQKCSYAIHGDITKGGVIYCAVHGPVDDPWPIDGTLHNHVIYEYVSTWQTKALNKSMIVIEYLINIPLALLGLLLSWVLFIKLPLEVIRLILSPFTGSQH